MNRNFEEQFEALMEKYTELLLGTVEKEQQENVKYWALYTQIAKTMPALAKHWNQLYPDGKEEMKRISFEVKRLNGEHRARNARENK